MLTEGNNFSQVLQIRVHALSTVLCMPESEIFGAMSALTGGITVGQLSCFLSYANQYTKPFNEISGVITELQNALACAARIFELIEEKKGETGCFGCGNT